jgi:hypothetical protein
MPDDNTIDTSVPHPASPLAGLGPETITNIALQSRPLSPKESATINDAFGGAINPADIRIAYDGGISGTNVRGYVLAKHLPTVMFFPTDLSTGEASPAMLHEATHVWQDLTNGRFTNPSGVRAKPSKDKPVGYAYDKDAADNLPFTEFGTEQQPEMVAANEKSARAFVRAHAANRPFPGDMAFLDSVRARYAGRKDLSDDMRAKINADYTKKPYSAVEQVGNEIKFKPATSLQKKTTMPGQHNVVLENLRTKFPAYRNVDDGKLLAALLHTHPSYVQHVGDDGLRLALQSGHKPNGSN